MTIEARQQVRTGAEDLKPLVRRSSGEQRHPVTVPPGKPESKRLPATSGSERQQRYRASRDLASIDVSAAVRQTIQDLRGRLRTSTDAVLRQALALLAAQHEPSEAVDKAENKTSRKSPGLNDLAPKRSSAARRGNIRASSPGDVSDGSARSSGSKQRSQAKPRAKRMEDTPVFPGLFNDDMEPPATEQPVRKR